MPALSRRADHRGDHLIVCGDGPLSYRITEELTSRYGERVTVILPSLRRNYGPQISALARVQVLEHPELSSQAFTDAGVQSARALAVVWQDDVGNLHAGLRATELNPGLRLVLAIFNRRLGDHIRMLFPDCTVLSGTAMSAPSFVAAALGEPAPSHVRVQRRTLYVARPADVAPGAVICGLATPDDDQESPRLLPPGADRADLVLAVADGTPRNPLTRRRNPARAAAGLFRRLVWHKFGLVFAALIAVIGAGFWLLATRYAFANAVYLALMDLTGSALTSPIDSGAEKTAQVLLTLDGMAFIPVITAIVVGARLTGSVRKAPRPPGGHVIVVGLGNVGTAVTGQLHDLGFDVVCVDNNPDAAGIPMARKLGLPVVVGDAFLEETLRAASLDTCLALVSVTSQDIVNPGNRLERTGAQGRPAHRAPAHRRRPGRTAAEDDRHHRLAERALPGRAGLRRRDARTSGASDHRRGPARAADRRRPGRAGPGREFHQGHRAGRAGARARAASRRLRRA